MSYESEKLTINKVVADVALNSVLQQDIRDYDIVIGCVNEKSCVWGVVVRRNHGNNEQYSLG